MYCPTCASPLPVGAMFCGECGRAVSSADLAAARRRADAAAEHVDATSAPDLPAPPPRATSHPRRGDGAEPPWWVRDRQVDTRDDADAGLGADSTRAVRPASVPEPPAWPVDDVRTEQVAVEQVPVERVPVERFPTEQRPVGPVDTEEGRVDTPGESRPAKPPASVGAEPAPLRSPSKHPDNGPRPTSAPLWTASLTPIQSAERRSDDDPSEVEAVRSEATGIPAAEGPERSAVRRDGRAGDGAPAVDESSVDESATGPAAGSSPGEARSAVDTHTEAQAAAGPEVDESVTPDVATPDPAGPPPLVRPTAEAPQDGDTAPVAALGRDARPAAQDGPPTTPDDSIRPAPFPPVRPVPLVEPGSAVVVERCTHCGAAIGEDDIFCGECGAVVQSVALSFTGPVVPLPPEWRPDDESVVRRDPTTAGGTETRADEDEADADESTGGAGEAVRDDAPPTVASDDRPSPPSTAAPEPVAHVPGFRAERPAELPRPVIADLPPAPSPSSAAPWGPRRPPVDLSVDDDVDETRIVRRGPSGTEYVLQFSTGESITIGGTGLVGRAPTPQPGEGFDQLVRIVDPGKSVSKTHLEFGQEAGALWISDRWSGNGTVVRPRDLPPRRADPGVRVRVTRGTRVEIGEQFFVVV